MTTEIIDNVEIHFDSEVDSGSNIKERVLIAYEKNKHFFGCSLMKGCVIRLVYSREAMNSLLKRETEEWVAGSTTMDGTVYIFSPKVFSTVSNHPSSNFDPVLTHELAHIFTDEFSRFGQPVWLKEGVAGYIAEQFKNKLPKKLNSFAQLHEKEDWGKSPNYAQASCFTTFLIDKFGKEQFLKFLKDLSENEIARKTFVAFTKLFANNFNVDFQQVSQEWQKSAAL